MTDTSASSKSLPVAGSTTATTTATALSATLESFRAIRELIVQAHPDNTDNVLVGNLTAQGIVLQPGESIAIPIENPHEVWVKAVSGTQHVGFLGRD